MFDLDGTLVDSMDCYHAVFIDAFTHFGLPVCDKAELMSYMRHGRNILEHVIPEDWPDREATTEKCRKMFRELWEERSLTDIRLHEQVKPTLQALQARGMTIGLATAARGAWIQHVLKTNGVADYFSAVVTRAEVNKHKPAPDLLLECLRRLEREPGRSVYVGDSPIDILAAKSAGARSIGVLSGASDRAALEEPGPELILEHVGHLPEVFGHEELGS